MHFTYQLKHRLDSLPMCGCSTHWWVHPTSTSAPWTGRGTRRSVRAPSSPTTPTARQMQTPPLSRARCECRPNCHGRSFVITLGPHILTADQNLHHAWSQVKRLAPHGLNLQALTQALQAPEVCSLRSCRQPQPQSLAGIRISQRCATCIGSQSPGGGWQG